MVTQPREAVGEEALLELPAGKLDEEGEEPIDTARRELAEEIGKGARDWAALTTFFTSPGLLDEKMHLFLATDLYDESADWARTTQDRDRGGSAQPSSTTRSSRCRDAKSLVGLLWLKARIVRLTDRSGVTATLHRGGMTRAPAKSLGRGNNRTIRRSPAVRAPRPRLPGVPRVRARPVAQHARGIPIRPPAVRALPGGARS